MENAPVITLNGHSPYPGSDNETWERFTKWGNEVYYPLMMNFPERKGIDIYQIVEQNPLYPLRLVIHHHESLTSLNNNLAVSDLNSVRNDVRSWTQRNVMDHLWSAPYRLVKGFRCEPAFPENKPDTRIQNAPVMHLEAYRLFSEEQDKYARWFAENSLDLFVPLFLKQKGIKAYDCYQLTSASEKSHFVSREKSYPIYITIMYLENIQAFDNFEKSPERATFLQTIRNVFPLGLNYQWYVQYQLVKSFRK